MITMTGRPIGIAMLRCPQCGKVYSRKKECFSQKQAISWSAWMMQNYRGTCPDCHKRRLEHGLQKQVHSGS